MLDDFYFADPRVTLIPVEHLSPDGIDASFAATLRARCGWSDARLALFDAGFATYWERLSALAQRGRDLSPPRLRNVAVVGEPDAVRPFASLLNTSTWTLHACDLDPERSDAELVAYLLAHGDRMAETGEVTLPAVHLAAWWFERSAAEREAFTAAARASTRPDAATYRAVADAIPWLRELRHRPLRPPRAGAHRPIPGTGLLVPRTLEQQPDRLVTACREAATATLAAFHARWRGTDPDGVRALLAWLADDAPPLLVTARRGEVVWDPETPAGVEPLRERLASAGPAAVRDVAADLRVVATHTRRFHAALVDPAAALPAPDPDSAQSGYAYLHRTRGRIAYNLDEPGIERLAGPALPYARAMLGARAAHEWAHLAVDAGMVPRSVDETGWEELLDALATRLDEVIVRAPRPLRDRTATDLRVLSRDGGAGRALAGIFASRLPDYQSNLLAFRFLDLVEREAYVRQNIRPLGREYQPAQLWRQLVRALYEYQYLGFSALPDARSYFLEHTWFAHDFFACGALEEEAFDALAAAAHALCAAHAIDAARIRPPAGEDAPRR